MSDFLIVEYRNDIGGRVAHTTFGAKPDGTPYTVELGANWVGLSHRTARVINVKPKESMKANQDISLGTRLGDSSGWP